MSEDEDATLYLTHVVVNRVYDCGGPIYGQEPSVSMVVLDQSTREQLEKKLLDHVPEEIQNRVETIILFGVPFLEIIITAKDKNVDLIMIGT